ncbi:5-carboxymethyl-2-hydroxymuconate isomerase [Sphaerotilus mobilis]|uniref:5-carboxymethyl-2-hydroxymuconate isomerase n=1 Tax=Sphaerotilus mobilis TaxID=47994 RepID=A0A4Q7LTG0_9BURK|nr:5-carboxymethyl-2-hydroxymuconate isomerase [Sphaerotilus mobilis]RZS57984.1 5-carboxymethyl-2-hydroxymuconate isomerase [Sphaerotilus mobilis]
MPHLVILYTATLDRPADQGGADMTALCRALADAMVEQRDETGKAVFPVGGVRVLAYPAAHHAVSDGGAAGRAAGGDGVYDFVYLNLRMARGRSAAVHRQVGEALTTCARSHFAPLLATRHIGITLQVDEGAEVFDAKTSTLHPLFQPPAGTTPKA